MDNNIFLHYLITLYWEIHKKIFKAIIWFRIKKLSIFWRFGFLLYYYLTMTTSVTSWFTQIRSHVFLRNTNLWVRESGRMYFGENSWWGENGETIVQKFSFDPLLPPSVYRGVSQVSPLHPPPCRCMGKGGLWSI